jgi:hypothetical protein
MCKFINRYKYISINLIYILTSSINSIILLLLVLYSYSLNLSLLLYTNTLSLLLLYIYYKLGILCYNFYILTLYKNLKVYISVYLLSINKVFYIILLYNLLLS